MLAHIPGPVKQSCRPRPQVPQATALCLHPKQPAQHSTQQHGKLVHTTRSAQHSAACEVTGCCTFGLRLILPWMYRQLYTTTSPASNGNMVGKLLHFTFNTSSYSTNSPAA